MTYQVADQGDAAAAAGSRSGGRLDPGHIAASVGDRGADLVLGHRVAGADEGAAGQCPDAESDPGTSAGGECGDDEQLQALGGGHRPPAHLQQGVVHGGIAHQDPPEDRANAGTAAGPPVGGGGGGTDDQPLVHLGHGVVVGDRLGTWRGPEGVAEAGHVHAHQLQLGGQVAACEGAVAAEDPVRDDRGHLVARRHQAPQPSDRQGALADGVDGRVRGAARLVDDDPAPLAYCQPGGARQVVSRPDACGEHDQVDTEVLGCARRCRAARR